MNEGPKNVVEFAGSGGWSGTCEQSGLVCRKSGIALREQGNLGGVQGGSPSRSCGTGCWKEDGVGMLKSVVENAALLPVQF